MNAVGLGDVVQQFDLTQYVPASIQTDYATGASYYAQFKDAAQHVTLGPSGSIQLDDQASELIENAIVTTVAQTVPVLGQAFAVLMALAPKAGAGPGTCASQPPGVYDHAHPKPSELQGWSYYTPWSKLFGAYNAGDPNGFELYANTALQWNWELLANCFGDLWIPPPVLLGALIASWNATHAGPQRTVTRSGLNGTGWGLPPGYDPIANALEFASIGVPSSSPDPSSGPISFTQAQAAQASSPTNVTSSFTINDGPEIGPSIGPVGPSVIHLKLATSAAAPMSTGSKVALSAAIVAGAAAGGVGVWAFMTHQAYGEAWSRVWKKSGGKLWRKV